MLSSALLFKETSNLIVFTRFFFSIKLYQNISACSFSCLFDDLQNVVLLLYLLTFSLLCLEGVQMNLNWEAEPAGYKNAVAESWSEILLG